MKCFCCGTRMINYNDYSTPGGGWYNVARCPKCNSHATYSTLEGIYTSVEWKLHHKYSEHENRLFKSACERNGVTFPTYSECDIYD